VSEGASSYAEASLEEASRGDGQGTGSAPVGSAVMHKDVVQVWFGDGLGEEATSRCGEGAPGGSMPAPAGLQPLVNTDGTHIGIDTAYWAEFDRAAGSASLARLTCTLQGRKPGHPGLRKHMLLNKAAILDVILASPELVELV
jgi:hypothetical protein